MFIIKCTFIETFVCAFYCFSFTFYSMNIFFKLIFVDILVYQRLSSTLVFC